MRTLGELNLWRKAGFGAAMIGGLITVAACGPNTGATAAGTVTVKEVTTVTVQAASPKGADASTTTKAAGVAPASLSPATSAPAAANGLAVGIIGTALPLSWKGGGDSVTATAMVAVYSAKWLTETPGDMGQKPSHGAFLVLDIGFLGKTGALHYNPYFLKIKDAEGQEYDSGIAQVPQPSLSSGNLNAGDKARGSVVFDLPRGPVTLMLSDSGVDSLAKWQIPA